MGRDMGGSTEANRKVFSEGVEGRVAQGYDNFASYLDRGKRKYGGDFDPSNLAPQFIPYYESGERIEVKFGYGGIERGTVGVTSGWKPVFILMWSVRSIASSDVLGKNDEVIAVIKGRKRIPVGNEKERTFKENQELMRALVPEDLDPKLLMDDDNTRQSQQQFLTDPIEIKKWLDTYGVKDYTINPDGTVDVAGNVYLSSTNIERFAVKFGSVGIYFDCSYCPFLTTLQGAPSRVGMYFDCSDCPSLTTLQGAPSSVGGSFYCSYCPSLTSLQGAPSRVGVYFYCFDNTNISLEGLSLDLLPKLRGVEQDKIDEYREEKDRITPEELREVFKKTLKDVNMDPRLLMEDNFSSRSPMK